MSSYFLTGKNEIYILTTKSCFFHTRRAKRRQPKLQKSINEQELQLTYAQTR